MDAVIQPCPHGYDEWRKRKSTRGQEAKRAGGKKARTERGKEAGRKEAQNGGSPQKRQEARNQEDMGHARIGIGSAGVPGGGTLDFGVSGHSNPTNGQFGEGSSR